MKYDIVVQDATVMVKMTDGTTTETLTLLDPPSENCMLVQQNKKFVLGEIDLVKMLTNLDRCVDLLQITFNAVDGFSVQSKVQILSNKFIDAMSKSNNAALGFKLASYNVMETYILAYENLFYGETETAVELLADTNKTASDMVKRADELINIYAGLTTYTNDVLVDVMNERVGEEQKRTETRALINDLEGAAKAMESIKKSLATDIKQYDAEYKDLQAREIKQEERAYNMQLASTILSAVSMVASFGGAMGSNINQKNERDKSEQQVSSTASKTTMEATARRDYSDNINKQTQNSASTKKSEERIVAIDKILDGKLYKDGKNNASTDAAAPATPVDPDTKKTDVELIKEKEKNVAEINKLKNEQKVLKGSEVELGKALTGLGLSLDNISKGTHENAQAIQKAVDSLAVRSDNIREKRDKLKDQERMNTAKLAENTAKIKYMVMDENAIESAIQCLVIAVECLRKVLSYLQEIKLFWMNVQLFCKDLALNNNLKTMISKQENKSIEKRSYYFKTPLFVKGYINTIAKWQALHVIFSEYSSALSNISKKMRTTLEQSLDSDRKVQWKLASELAGKLNKQLEEEFKKGIV